MNPVVLDTIPARLAFAGSVLIIPFISWGNPPWLSGLFVLFLAGTFLAQLWHAKNGKGPAAPASPLWPSFTGFLILSVLHLARSPVPYASFTFTVQLILVAVFLYLALSGMKSPGPQTAAVVWTIIIVPWISAQYLSGVRPPGGPFANPNYTATVLLCCLALALGSLLPDRGQKKETAAIMAVSMACTAALMMIGSRSAGLGMILLWTIFLFLRKSASRWLAVLVMAALLIVPNTLRYRVTEGYRADPHAFSRIQIWKVALRMGADHPLLGVGPNLFYDYSPVYAFPTETLPVRYGRIARKPHSEYLRIWAAGGVAGAVIAGLFIVNILKLMLVSRSWARAGPVMATSIFMYQAFFHDLTEVFALTALFVWLIAGISRDTPSRPGRADGKPPGILLVSAGILVVCCAVWFNLDLASRALWQNGRMMMKVDTEAARISFERALFINPILPWAARDLAQVLRVQEGPEPDKKVLKQIDASISRARLLNRLDTVPLRLRAALYKDIARAGNQTASKALDVAAMKLREAAALEPHNAVIWLNLSEILWDLGRYKEADDLLERALDEEPNYLEAHRKKISRLQQVAPSRAPAAIREFRKTKERADGYRPQSRYEEIILR